ncbi:MAG: CBS domain-containing protein [Planctomycetota bacterium]
MSKPPKLPTAADFMVRHVHTLAPETKLEQAVEYLLKHEISNVPVLSGETDPPTLVGFLSESDCLEHLANDTFYNRSGSEVRVEQMMKRQPICVPPEADLFTLATIFYQQGFRHLPVVEDRHLLGIVSRRDVLKAMYEYWQDFDRFGESKRFRPDLSQITNLRFIVK